MPNWADDPDFDQGLLEETKKKVEKPPRYKVLLHNDDFTTMEFVVSILINVFHKTEEVARSIMMNVHLQGIGVAGVFSYEIAEAKVNRVTDLARANEFPLLCTMEEE